MDGKTGGKRQLEFTDAEINAAASIVNAMIAGGVQFCDDRVVEVYGRLLGATAEAKLRLKYELVSAPPEAVEFNL